MAGSTTPAHLDHRYALCVGIGTYSNINNHDLRYAVDDAKAIADVFSDPARGNFKVTLLTKAEETTKDILMKELRSIEKSASGESNSLLVIYFSYHGEVYGTHKTFCLLPSDAVIEEYSEVDDNTVIDVYEIAKRLSNANVKNIVMLLDVCYSGGAGDALQYLRQSINSDKSIYVIAAAPREQTATQSSQLQHGIFTDALLLAFRDKPNRSDGWLTLTQIEDVSQLRILPKMS